MALTDYLNKIADEGTNIGLDYLRHEIGPDQSIQGTAAPGQPVNQAGVKNTDRAPATVPPYNLMDSLFTGKNIAVVGLGLLILTGGLIMIVRS